MTSEDRRTLLDDLRASREHLLAVVAGVSEEQFKRRPAFTPAPAPSQPAERGEPTAGDWSIAEVLAHLLASEQRLCVRLEASLRGENPPEPALSEEERSMEARLGRTVPVPQVIHGLLAARRRLERALGGEDGAMATPGPDLTPEAMALVRADVIAHEAEHRQQIEAVKQVLGAARPATG